MIYILTSCGGRSSMKPRAGLMSVLVVSALIFGFTGRAMAVQYLWQVALEEVEGSMQHEYAKKFVEIIENKSNGNIRCNIHFYGPPGCRQSSAQTRSGRQTRALLPETSSQPCVVIRLGSR